MNYEELVKALRHCGKDLMPGERCKDSCPYGDIALCLPKLKLDAAAAIEELQAVLKEADKKQAYQHDCICELTAENEELKDEVKRLEPKRCEWITIRLNDGGSYTGCSCCEAPIPTDTMLDYIPESESKYCYSCGAKMDGERRDGGSHDEKGT